MMKRIFVIAAFVLIVSGLARAQVKQPPSELTMKLEGLDGKVNDLAGLRGNVVLVSFGATWCAPCTAELRALQELLGEYRDKPVKFFWVSIESSQQVTNNELRRYAKERKLTFPVLRDATQMVFLQFAQRVRLPMIVMLRKDGKLDAPVQFGMRTPAEAYKSDIRARLNKLLAVPSAEGN